MDDKTIQDIPSIQELLQQLQALESLKQAMPLIKPFLSLFGVNTDEIGEALNPLEELAGQIKELSRIPDRFSRLIVLIPSKTVNYLIKIKYS